MDSAWWRRDSTPRKLDKHETTHHRHCISDEVQAGSKTQMSCERRAYMVKRALCDCAACASE